MLLCGLLHYISGGPEDICLHRPGLDGFDSIDINLLCEYHSFINVCNIRLITVELSIIEETFEHLRTI